MAACNLLTNGIGVKVSIITEVEGAATRCTFASIDIGGAVAVKVAEVEGSEGVELGACGGAAIEAWSAGGGLATVEGVALVAGD